MHTADHSGLHASGEQSTHQCCRVSDLHLVDLQWPHTCLHMQAHYGSGQCAIEPVQLQTLVDSNMLLRRPGTQLRTSRVQSRVPHADWTPAAACMRTPVWSCPNCLPCMPHAAESYLTMAAFMQSAGLLREGRRPDTNCNTALNPAGSRDTSVMSACASAFVGFVHLHAHDAGCA